MQHLDNRIEQPDCMPYQEGNTDMAKINRAVMINGEKRWIRANTEQEYCDKLLKLTGTDQQERKSNHPFPKYALNWFETYSKPNIESVTAITYQRQIKKYLIPAFEWMAIEDISTDEVQRLFNNMNGAKSTKDKTKIVLNQILDAAVEDNLLPKNPLKSKRLKITGRESKTTAPYSVDQMRYLVQHIGDVKQSQDRAYLALQAFHPLRLEEVLGLKWADIDMDNGAIYICRAVTHPDRNRPEIKGTKTERSNRNIGLVQLATQYLIPGNSEEFVLGGSKPLSYQQVKRMCLRIQADTGFSEKITPIRFRTTVLTDLYESTHDIKLVQAAAGHTSSAMTLKHYVKGRQDILQATASIESVYA